MIKILKLDNNQWEIISQHDFQLKFGFSPLDKMSFKDQGWEFFRNEPTSEWKKNNRLYWPAIEFVHKKALVWDDEIISIELLYKGFISPISYFVPECPLIESYIRDQKIDNII